jgi:hypothetical protein
MSTHRLQSINMFEVYVSNGGGNVSAFVDNTFHFPLKYVVEAHLVEATILEVDYASDESNRSR